MKDTNVQDNPGSWPNTNTADKISYDINALKQMKDGPLSKNKPQTTSQLEAYDLMRTSPLPDYTFSLASIQRPKSDFLPTFVDPFSKNTPRDLRKDGKPNMFSGKSGIKISTQSPMSPMKSGRISMSLREDVKLNKSENAWVPSRFKSEKLTNDEEKTEELYKTFRGILNKLTPEKFDTLMEKVKKLEINTQERLEGVINLVFEKAIYEPKYSKAYAVMCNRLAGLKVPAKNATTPDQFVVFRALLINRCQSQFQTKKVEESVIKLESEIAKCDDPAKRKELQTQLEEENRNVRMRSVGNVRFIGELYKLHMLTAKIMMFCLDYLVHQIQEEKLECLCKLLTTIGEQLEGDAKGQLEVIFKKMQDIVDKKGAVSSRVRFMLEDVVALRRRRWVARAVQDLQPKTMEQIQREADMQQRNIEIMNATPMRRDGGGGGGGGGGARRRGGERRPPAPYHEPPRVSYSVDTNKLKAGINKMQSLSSTKLAPTSLGWVRGAGLRGPPASAPPSSAPAAPLSNKYSLLTDADDAPLPPPLPDRTKLEGSVMQSRSQANNDDISLTSSSGPAPADIPPVETASHSPSENKKSGVKAEDPFDMKKVQVKSAVELFLMNADLEDVAEVVRRVFPPAQHAPLVAEVIDIALEKSPAERAAIAQLILELVTNGTISEEALVPGLQSVLEYAPDIFIDVPKLYDYLACFITLFIQNKIFELAKLHAMSGGVVSSGQGGLLVRAVLSPLPPAEARAQWRAAKLAPHQWMDEKQVEKFIADTGFTFLNESATEDATSAIDSLYLVQNDNFSEQGNDTDVNDSSRDDRDTSDNCDESNRKLERSQSNLVSKTQEIDRHKKQIDSDSSEDKIRSHSKEPDRKTIRDVKCEESISKTKSGESIVKTDSHNLVHICNIDLSQNLNQNTNVVAKDLKSDENLNTLESCNVVSTDSSRNYEENLQSSIEDCETDPKRSIDLTESDDDNSNRLKNVSMNINIGEEENEAVLEERLFAMMTAGESCERLLSGLQKERDASVAARALTRAVCRHALSGARAAAGDFDERALRAYMGGLSVLGAGLRHQLHCVIGVQNLILRMPQHQESLLAILQYLLEEDALTMDALLAYEQLVCAPSDETLAPVPPLQH